MRDVPTCDKAPLQQSVIVFLLLLFTSFTFICLQTKYHQLQQLPWSCLWPACLAHF
jgi:hypothetical protein